MHLPRAACAQQRHGLRIGAVADEDDAFPPHRGGHRTERPRRTGGEEAGGIPIFHKNVGKRNTRLLRVAERRIRRRAGQRGHDVGLDRMSKREQTARPAAQRGNRYAVKHRVGARRRKRLQRAQRRLRSEGGSSVCSPSSSASTSSPGAMSRRNGVPLPSSAQLSEAKA